MTKKYNMFFVLGFVWIAYVLGAIAQVVGKVSDCDMEPNGWDMLPKALIMVGIPFVLGYFAGKGDA